jgi:uncharacterized protein (UPF0371 family)
MMEQWSNALPVDRNSLLIVPIPGDEAGLIRLGVNLTSDPNFPSRALYVT